MTSSAPSEFELDDLFRPQRRRRRHRTAPKAAPFPDDSDEGEDLLDRSLPLPLCHRMAQNIFENKFFLYCLHEYARNQTRIKERQYQRLLLDFPPPPHLAPYADQIASLRTEANPYRLLYWLHLIHEHAHLFQHERPRIL